MRESDKDVLEEAGWSIECESPLEIRTKDGSFATQEAAFIVLSDLRQEFSKKDKYIIINLENLEVFKNIDGSIKYFDSEIDAGITCGMYELENVWISKLVYNHIE